jgi:Putative MetA-pathway of phenol degradation
MLQVASSRFSRSTLVTTIIAGSAASAESDKSAYSLIKPTPRELMREMSTDRPDATESPYTVDAGHLQVEMSFIEFSREDDGPREDAFAYAPINLKLGLLNNLDAQLILAPYERLQVEGDEDSSGFGDTQLRVKWNLWGNDSGDSALALMPFVKFPTGDGSFTNNHVEGGMIVPFALALPAEFSLGLMAEFDIVRDEADEGYEIDFVHSAVLGRDLFGPVGVYAEYLGIAGTDAESDYRAFFNTGLTIAVTPDVQLDAGVQIGLTDEAEDLGVFVGVSFRY